MSGRPRAPSPALSHPHKQVLLKDGAEFLRAFVENAEPFPIRGLFRWAAMYMTSPAHAPTPSSAL